MHSNKFFSFLCVCKVTENQIFETDLKRSIYGSKIFLFKKNLY